MAPHAINDDFVNHSVGIANIKSQVLVRQIELDVKSAPPVADEFMYDFKYNHALPTSDVLGVSVPLDCDASTEAEDIIARLSKAMKDGDATAFTELFLDYGRYGLD